MIPIFINYFWLNGGFIAINNLLRHDNKMIPLDALSLLTKIISLGTVEMKPKYLKPLIKNLTHYVI